jgi:hypothetical protein
MLLPGNRFEALRGKRNGQYSIRINDQWRICFTWPSTENGTNVHFSPAALNRLLDPENTSVSLNTLEKAATAPGKKLEVHLA